MRAKSHPPAAGAGMQKPRLVISNMPAKINLSIIKKVDLKTRLRLRRASAHIHELVEYAKASFRHPCQGISLCVVYSPFEKSVSLKIFNNGITWAKRTKKEEIGIEIKDPLYQLSSVTFDEILVQRGFSEENDNLGRENSYENAEFLCQYLRQKRWRCRKLQLLGVRREELGTVLSNIDFIEFDGSRLDFDLKEYLNNPILKNSPCVKLSFHSAPSFSLYNAFSHREHVELHNSTFAYNFGDHRISYMEIFHDFLFDVVKAPMPCNLKYLRMDGANFTDLLRCEEQWPPNCFLFRGQYAIGHNTGANWITIGIRLIHSPHQWVLIVSTTNSFEENRWEQVHFLETDNRESILNIVLATAFKKFPLDISHFADAFYSASCFEMAEILFDISTNYGYFCSLDEQ